MSQPKYLDSASTTPVDPRVKEAMLPYFDEIFGNASSNHIYGKKAKQVIDVAREHVAKIINANSKEIVFTSGATEAINLGIKGYIQSNKEKGNHIITVKTEHKAVLNTCEYLESIGTEITYLGVDENGLIYLEELKKAIREDTLLICVMYVNNEIGVIQDIDAIGTMAKENNIAFFCDATQAVGKIPVNVKASNIDLLCMSAHKFNGPKGIGALYIKEGIKITPQIHGGSQENGLRAGTYNTPLIVGLGKACELALLELDSNYKKLKEKQVALEKHYQENNIGTINCKGANRAPHIISVCLNNMETEEYLMLNAKEMAISTGSACNSSIVEDSHVLKELNVTFKNSIRISYG